MNIKNNFIPFSFLAIFFLSGLQVNAQEVFETDTVYANTSWTTWVILPSRDFTAAPASPDNFGTFFTMKKVEASIKIDCRQPNIEFGVVNVTEPKGLRRLIIIYQKLVPEGDDPFTFDFSGGSKNIAPAANIVLPRMNESEIRKDLTTQKDPIPYNGGEGLSILKNKYPDINFYVSPEDQLLNLVATQQNPVICEEVMAKEELNLAYGNSEVPVNLVCKALVINGPDAYLKILIQNKGTDEFLTGTMFMTWISKNGTVKLYPGYFCPRLLPIVQVGKQMAIIYPFKAFAIADDDELKFEMHDRRKKINVEFSIRGAEYNAARNN